MGGHARLLRGRRPLVPTRSHPSFPLRQPSLRLLSHNFNLIHPFILLFSRSHSSSQARRPVSRDYISQKAAGPPPAPIGPEARARGCTLFGFSPSPSRDRSREKGRPAPRCPPARNRSPSPPGSDAGRLLQLGRWGFSPSPCPASQHGSPEATEPSLHLVAGGRRLPGDRWDWRRPRTARLPHRSGHSGCWEM